MQEIFAERLKRLKQTRVRRMRMIAILLVLSLVVSLDVFWILRQPGLTLAGNADCGITEHTHSEHCQNGNSPCTLTEHVHSIDCYSNQSADTETQLDWQQLFANYPFTGDLRSDLVGIAKMQVGYTESKQNFQVDSRGNRHGYTRYGAWYGLPYHDWSAMFVSFCLHFAGADPTEFPGNIGAISMENLWKKLGKYASSGSYTPSPGDLVFFRDNTVGIVAEVQNATAYVIRGDVNQEVSSDVFPLTDETIVGWGLLDNPLSNSTTTFDPVVTITAGNQEAQRATPYAFRMLRSITDLLPYLEANGGSYFLTLLDYNNMEVPKDDQGNYMVSPNTRYKLTATFTSPNGFLPGTYQHQIVNGLMVGGGEGSFLLQDKTNVGQWVVTDTGLITMVFNDQIANHADITISTTMVIQFPEQDDPIDFDGKISVKVEPPEPQDSPTALSKWGSPSTNTNKINWTVRIDGHADSQIPGNILTDQPALSDWSRPHSYTPSDIAGGLSFGVSDPNGGWHNWHIPADDPHLIWDENGWSYKMPQTVTCDYCGELELGNDGWIYLINYTSTPTALNTSGTFDYENKVTIDGQTAWGWSNFTHGEVAAEIIKNGSFAADAAGGAFLWEFQATIPGRVHGQRAEYSWFIMDEMRLLDANGNTIDRVHNDVNLALVIANYNGTTIHIPRIQDATDEDMFAWDNAWTATENGISHTRTINLLCRCQCTPETCHWTGCGEYWFQRDDGTWATNGFCQCWTETQNMTFTFVYKTSDLSLIQGYGALGYQVYNQAQLYYMPDSNNSARVSSADVAVPIPNLFEKQLTHDFDGYTANYKITVNEAKLVLTDGSPLHIHDEMTSTLAYISGSLVITAEDVNGNIVTLKQGTDYTVTYDGTGSQTDGQGNKVHVLDITILHPQPVMYTLDYDTTLIIPEHVTGAIKYSNYADITLWGESIGNSAVEKVHADINISTKSFRVQISKTSAETGESLSGAVFGLYNSQGGLIATETTGLNGMLTFQTNIVHGIILREHVLYYIQEIKAPAGYQLDDTKYWFCFCDKKSDSCQVCDEVLAGLDAVRIPFEQINQIPISNELLKYELPATGGSGIYPLILVSVVFVITPLVYMSIRRRKQERRGVG